MENAPANGRIAAAAAQKNMWSHFKLEAFSTSEPFNVCTFCFRIEHFATHSEVLFGTVFARVLI